MHRFSMVPRFPGVSPRANAFAPLGLLALQTLSAGAEALFVIVWGKNVQTCTAVSLLHLEIPIIIGKGWGLVSSHCSAVVPFRDVNFLSWRYFYWLLFRCILRSFFLTTLLDAPVFVGSAFSRGFTPGWCFRPFGAFGAVNGSWMVQKCYMCQYGRFSFCITPAAGAPEPSGCHPRLLNWGLQILTSIGFVGYEKLIFLSWDSDYIPKAYQDRISRAARRSPFKVRDCLLHCK